MNKEFIPYEQALALKELGFDEPCFGTWDRPYKLWTGNPVNGVLNIPEDVILAPLYQQAFRWFREKHGICSWIERLYTEDSVAYYRTTQEYKKDTSSKMHNLHVGLKEYNTYEEAEQACLNKLIEIVKHDKGQV